MNNFTLPQQLQAEIDYPSGQKIATFRREYTRFFIEFETFFKKLNVGLITSMTQSENGAGWITLTIAYFETKHVTPQREASDAMASAK